MNRLTKFVLLVNHYKTNSIIDQPCERMSPDQLFYLIHRFYERLSILTSQLDIETAVRFEDVRKLFDIIKRHLNENIDFLLYYLVDLDPKIVVKAIDLLDKNLKKRLEDLVLLFYNRVQFKELMRYTTLNFGNNESTLTMRLRLYPWLPMFLAYDLVAESWPGFCRLEYDPKLGNVIKFNADIFKMDQMKYFGLVERGIPEINAMTRVAKLVGMTFCCLSALNAQSVHEFCRKITKDQEEADSLFIRATSNMLWSYYYRHRRSGSCSLLLDYVSAVFDKRPITTLIKASAPEHNDYETLLKEWLCRMDTFRAIQSELNMSSLRSLFAEIFDRQLLSDARDEAISDIDFNTEIDMLTKEFEREAGYVIGNGLSKLLGIADLGGAPRIKFKPTNIRHISLE